MNKNYLKIRINEIITSIEFQAILIISSLIFCFDYFFKIASNIGLYQFQRIDYFNMFFSNGNIDMLISGYYFHVIILVLSVAATATLYINDKNIGLKNKFIMVLGRQKYHINNIIVVFITTFILIFLPLFINFLLTLLNYNLNKYIDLGRGIFYSPIYDYNMPLVSIYKISPLLLNLVYVFIPSIVMSIWSTFIYSLSLFIKDAKAYHISIISLIILMISQMVMDFLGYTQLKLSEYLNPISISKNRLNFTFFLAICLIIFVVSIIGVTVKSNYFKDEI